MFLGPELTPQQMAQTIATRAALIRHRVGRTVAAYGSIPVLPDRLRTDRRFFDRLGEAVESHFLSFWGRVPEKVEKNSFTYIG